MNAQELTILVDNHRIRIEELEKTVKYLEQELEKQRLLVQDMSYDVMDLQRSRR